MSEEFDYAKPFETALGVRGERVFISPERGCGNLIVMHYVYKPVEAVWFNDAGSSQLATYVLHNIESAEPFMSLFPRREDVEKKLEESMREAGFADPAFPLVVWGTKLIDGYHRLRAAKNIGLEQVPVINKGFQSEDEAVLYCIHANADRRHLTDDELLNVIQEVDKRTRPAAQARERTGPILATSVARSKSADETAAIVGVSRRKVEEVRSIREHGTEEDMKQVEDGKATIHKKAEEVKARRKRKPRQLAPTDYRSEDQKIFDEAYSRLQGVLILLRDSDWVNVSFEGIQQEISRLAMLITRKGA